jgi:hypothetical protein
MKHKSSLKSMKKTPRSERLLMESVPSAPCEDDALQRALAERIGGYGVEFIWRTVEYPKNLIPTETAVPGKTPGSH